MKKLIIITVSVLLLAGCVPNELGDRSNESGGRSADDVSDVSHITIYRNIDRFPNVAIFCADGLAFASTSRGSGENGGGVSLLRLPERDGNCQ